MGDSRTRILTEHLKKIDSKLYATRCSDGRIDVYRKAKRFIPFEYEDKKFLYSVDQPNFILALTDNWSVRGKPVEWGIDPLIHRMQEIDAWNKGLTAEDFIKDYEKADESRARARMNSHEAFLKDARPAFKKAFNDINTSNMDVKENSMKRGI